MMGLASVSREKRERWHVFACVLPLPCERTTRRRPSTSPEERAPQELNLPVS